MIPRVLTLRAQRASPGTLEITCSTMAGNVAATLQWPDESPVTGLAQAVIAAVRSSHTLQEPLWVWNLRLLKADGTVALGNSSALLPEQLGLETKAPEV